MSASSQPNIFTCTFCFNLSQGPPQIIGRSARLACTTCHAALLNLAICWVCGELIFREDECVSFGWCFWHRACYGCLLYGSRAIYHGVPVQDLFLDEEVEDRRREGCGGKEVTEVPLCAACAVEVEVDGVKEESVVVNRGLRRIEKVDGGLTRKRWEAKNSEKDSKSSTWQPSINNTGDGVAGDEATANNILSNFRDASRSVIWVDIFDPINGPSFKPSPLKPIPLFMQRPPSPIREPQRTLSAIDTYLQAPPTLRKPHSAPGSVCPPESLAKSTGPEHHIVRQPSPPLFVSTPPQSSIRSRGHDTQQPVVSPQDYVGDNGRLDVRHKQAVSWIKEEPLKRPSSRLAASRRRSDANSSAYRTPPEYPDQVLRTAYPLHLSTVRAASPLPSQLTSHLQRTAPQSSEYLDRYQPATTRPAQNQEVRRLRRVAASLSEEGLGKTRSEDSESGEWGKVGTELRRFFTGR
ncbi:hypothetical protein FSARC_5222 [Fusarium sarcochroum]|uniref:LIM zinc-binding domain-containing protein n=1 Tax=Fusarium sarcochroum TaxID=1208366 RepID=A0A8H4XAM1_9HYPO|nr:hypothetical protein FSARC_5222 [Fusarium sarcochroum]